MSNDTPTLPHSRFQISASFTLIVNVLPRSLDFYFTVPNKFDLFSHFKAIILQEVQPPKDSPFSKFDMFLVMYSSIYFYYYNPMYYILCW